MHKSAFIVVVVSLLVASCNRPVSRFVSSQERVQAPSTVSFVNQSEKAETFLWDFGDGQTSGDMNPSHRFVQSGTYTVVLNAITGKKTRKSEQMISINPPQGSLVEIQTSFGNMLVKLYDETPEHQANFLKLSGEGYFNDLLFHRVIEGFMIQGGDPTSKGAAAGARLGSGGPGYQIPAEFNPSLIHKKGALSAARTGDAVNPEKKSSGSQFYIVQGQPVDETQLQMFERRKGMEYSDEQKSTYASTGGTPFLDMDYTVFGEVIEGLEVIDKIAALRKDAADRPEEDVKMKIVVIK
ncbi:MAG: peptidylprolyl isomerase [Saprospiraceae bacterium]|nr:peptidylprolyl isomerase [Saprospiraceae bacterium]